VHHKHQLLQLQQVNLVLTLNVVLNKLLFDSTCAVEREKDGMRRASVTQDTRIIMFIRIRGTKQFS
jgi:hypothetical protein